MGLSLNARLLLYYIMGIGIAAGLNPILDKTEIGEGETFTVTCDISRVTDTPYKTFSDLTIRRGVKTMVGSDEINSMVTLMYGMGCDPCLNGDEDVRLPWTAKFNTPTSSKASEAQMKLINTNSSCNDAGNFSCELYIEEYNAPGIRSTQYLRKKASCYLTSTTLQPTETTYSSVNDTEATPNTEPTTRGSGFEVNSPGKIFLLREILLFIVLSIV